MLFEERDNLVEGRLDLDGRASGQPSARAHGPRRVDRRGRCDRVRRGASQRTAGADSAARARVVGDEIAKRGATEDLHDLIYEGTGEDVDLGLNVGHRVGMVRSEYRTATPINGLWTAGGWVATLHAERGR